MSHQPGRSFSLLRSVEDWQVFETEARQNLRKAHQTLRETHPLLSSCPNAPDAIFLGTGPKTYPCLVTLHVPGTLALGHGVVCYVYPGEAEELLAARSSLPVPATTQDDYNRHVSAMLLAMAEIMIDTGIIKEDALEARILKFCSKVDQWTHPEAIQESSALFHLSRRLREHLVPPDPES